MAFALFKKRAGLMLQFASLFSGSAGNCLYIENDEGAILIDAGRSTKQILAALERLGKDPQALQALFLTHEHADHVSAVPVLQKRLGLPIFASEGTLLAAGLEGEAIVALQRVEVGSLSVLAVRGSHDARQPLCYRVDCLKSGLSMAVITDLGCYDEAFLAHFTGVDGGYIESNHDGLMLQNGPYPYKLKQRVASELGHLSNRDCAELCVHLAQNGARRFLLGHLSEQNNSPSLAFSCTTHALKEAQQARAAVCVAPRSVPSALIALGEEANILKI